MSFFIDVAYESLNKYGEELCGDKVEVVRGHDCVVVVMADGLGSGVKANILATLTTKIIGTMLERGAHIDEAVETIAHTLPVCNVRKLAYSTFSILQVFNSGEARLFEFDNPPVFFLREGKLISVPTRCRTINGRMIKESSFDVSLGDTFVMVSDGVIHAGVGATLNFGWKWENVADYLERNVKRETTAKAIAALLITVCDSLYMGRPGDDTTVVAVKIQPVKEVSLFAGPPISKSDDEKVVKEFMKGNGIKVVCGGTTAQIVSRVLGKEINTSLEYHDPSVPPTAKIDGIDLVTEGVLTLSRTIDIIRCYASDKVRYKDLKILRGQDGAAKLAHILIENCTHLRMFIGRAMNPAHQNPNFPVNLSIKFKLLEELAELMRSLGKTVEQYYY
ncbi:MAG: hypothetical protein PWR01_1096 [Clostridiales bacterium]|jgi:hypothetical protein|nr:hypothetical protein [Clostridiales bacterium]